MAKYNQKFWKERYSNENLIKEYFKNYNSFFLEGVPLEVIVLGFLAGEKEQIKEIFSSEKVQEEMYNNVKEVMKNVKEWYKDENL